MQLHKQPKTKKIGGERDELDLHVEPIPVQIRRSRYERISDALILVAIAIASQVIVSLLL